MILHMDATAGIIRRSEYIKRQMYLLSAVPDSPFHEVPPLSISDCITDECRVENAEFWLRRLRCDVSRLKNLRLQTEQSIPAVVVVDFSWVLIHVSLSAAWKLATFDKCVGVQPLLKKPRSILFACSSHFIARAARNLSRFFSSCESTARQLLLHCVAALICAPSLHNAEALWRKMLIIFGQAWKDDTWFAAAKELKIQLERMPINVDNPLNTDGNCATDPHNEDERKRTDLEEEGIRSSSPFCAFFAEPEDAEITESSSNHPNPFHKFEALKYIHKTWLPLYGLWGQCVLAGIPGIRQYLTNAKIESWFG